MDFSRRFEVLEEIVKTEQSYVNFLERLVKIFILPIRALVGTPEQVLSADDIKVLFANVEIIYQFNYELSAQLRTRMNNKRASFQLGDIFVKMTPYFKMYAEYLRNYDQSQALLLRLQAKHKDFKVFTEAQRAKHKEHMQLRDLLIMPVQRIPRYRLLLEELIKQTPPSNMDYQNIKEALQAIVEVADEVNKDIEEHERMNKIVAIENRLSNPPDNLVAPHRKFIREASFTRIEKHRKKEVAFFLFNDILVFAQLGNSFASAFKLGSKKLKVKIVCSLHAVSVLDIPESDDLNGHFFQLCISPQRKMLYFQSKNLEDKAGWIISLVETIADYTNKMNERMDNIQRADTTLPIELMKSDSASESNTPLNSPGPASPNVPANNSNSNNSSPKASRKSGSYKTGKKRTSGSHKEKKDKDKDKSDRPMSINEESVSESSAEAKGNHNGGMSVTLKPPVKDDDDEAGLLFEKLSLRASVMVNPADLHKFVQRENMKAGLKRPYETLRPTSPNRQSPGIPDRRMPSPTLTPNPLLTSNTNNITAGNTSPAPESPRNASQSVSVGSPPPPMARMASKPNLKSPPLSPHHPAEDQTSPSITKKPSDPALNDGVITKKASDPSLNTGQVTKKPSDPALNAGQVTKKPSDPALNTSQVNKDGGEAPTPMARPTPPTTPRGTSGGTLRKQPSIPDVTNQITNANTSPTPPITPRGNSVTLRKQPSVADVNANIVNSPNAPTPAPRRPSDPPKNSAVNSDTLRKQPSGEFNASNQITSPNGSTPPSTSPTPASRRPSDPKINANQISGPNSSPTPQPRISDANKPPLNLNGLKSSPTGSTNASPNSSKASSPRDSAPSVNGPHSAPPYNKRISAPESHRHDVNLATPSSPQPQENGEKVGPVISRPAAAGTRHALEKPVAPAPNAKGLAAPPKKRPMAVSGGPSTSAPGQQKQPPMLRNPSTGQLNSPKLPPRPGAKKASATSLDK
jgi:FYVE/RhoGEF/PH domain-containing protein 5/6